MISARVPQPAAPARSASAAPAASPTASARATTAGASLLRPLAGLAPLGAAALVLVAWAPPAAAQAKEDAVVKADIAFAKGLASRFSYVDIAERVIQRIEGRGVSEGLKEELDLAKCDVYAQGARNERDPAKRVELYEKAIEAYRVYITSYPFSDYLSEAERSYVDLANAFGRVLELELEDAVGEEAEALRTKIRTVLEEALKRTGDLISQLEDPQLPEIKKFERYRLMLNRGQMLLTLAKASTEGTFFFGQAEETLESLALEAGERTGWGLNAFLLLGQVKSAQGGYREAADFGGYVLETALPRDAAALQEMGWAEMTAEEKQRNWALAELSARDVIESHLNLGDIEAACEWGLHYYNFWKREGFELSPHGYLSLLAVARALLDSGGWVGGSIQQGTLAWFENEEATAAAGQTGQRNSRSALDMALSIAQTVNEENRGNTLQIRAQKLISDVIDRPGVVVEPDVLFEAAQGEYYAKNYQAAIEAFKKVLRSLETQDDATRQEYSPRVLWHIGSSLDRQGRSLEAAMAFREACTTWRGDPEYDPRNSAGFYEAIKVALKNAPKDEILLSLRQQAEELRIALDTEGDQSEIVLKQGLRAYDGEDYEGARTIFLSVERGGKVYEECIVRAALCLYKLQDHEAAAAEFRSYVDGYVRDPANALTDPARIASRQKALAMATFYLGRIAFDAGDWKTTVARLDGYQAAFPAQTDYGPIALYMVTNSRLGQQQLDEAKAVQAQMMESFPSSPFTGRAADAIYEGLTSLQAKAQEAADHERARSLKEQMAQYQRISNSLATTPSYAQHRLESKLWLELGNWEEAERSLRTVIDLFYEDPERAAEIDTHVKPDLAESLLGQHRIPEAFELLDPLVPDPRDKADTRLVSGSVVRSWCRSVAGWIEGDAKNIVEVPGVGGAENFAKATEQWERLIGSEAIQNKWDCTWYELKFEIAYAYFQWAQVDSSKLDSARRVLTDLRQLADDPEFDAVAARCGDDVLKARFQWLWRKVQ